MNIELYQLTNLLSDAADLAATKVMVTLGKYPETVSRREAYRRYGEGVVKRWIQEGLIEVKKDGDNTSKCRLDLVRLEALSKANNRVTYLSTAERQK